MGGRYPIFTIWCFCSPWLTGRFLPGTGRSEWSGICLPSDKSPRKSQKQRTDPDTRWCFYWNNFDCLHLQIFGKNLSIFGLRAGWESPHHDRHNTELTPGWLHHLGNVGQLHLDAVLVLVSSNTHQLELASVEQLLDDVSVDAEVAQWSLVDRALSHRAPGESHVVTGAQDEDGLDSVGVQLLEAVGSCWSTVAVASVGRDDSSGWSGELGGSWEPGGEFSVQLLRVARVPGVGVTGSPHWWWHAHTDLSTLDTDTMALILTTILSLSVSLTLDTKWNSQSQSTVTHFSCLQPRLLWTKKIYLQRMRNHCHFPVDWQCNELILLLLLNIDIIRFVYFEEVMNTGEEGQSTLLTAVDLYCETKHCTVAASTALVLH